MKYFAKPSLLFVFLCSTLLSFAQHTHQDTLRGTITPERAWWNVVTYKVHVTPDYSKKTISGKTGIGFRVIKPGSIMQVDLQQPLKIDSIWVSRTNQAHEASETVSINKFRRDRNAFFINTGNLVPGNTYLLEIAYHGKPREAVNPPWDGGWIWKKDEKGNPWMSVACQGLGASVWYPCKDHQSDEPDEGATLSVTVPDSLSAIGNGRLVSKVQHENGTTTWNWQVKNPINNYNIIPYIGKYATWHDEFNGEKGKLDLDYWVLEYNLGIAKKQFDRDVKPMLTCFEDWFGPYPFYEDGYKLVESPHLGMEHQSAVAYGNRYMNGYLGMDLSGSGWGNKWDYIIIHESGHEWFGNNITTNDIADMWVHEGFTDYSEPVFVECQYGKTAGDEYCQGLRRNIDNDRPVIGPYGVNKEGSGDMYAKGANLLHTIRQVINDDKKFKEILRGLNKEFYHKTITSKEAEDYISKKSGRDLSLVFDQYLRTIKIPLLEFKIRNNTVEYRWTNVVRGFNMPLRVTVGGIEKWLFPTEQWQKLAAESLSDDKAFLPDKNFYIQTRQIK